MALLMDKACDITPFADTESTRYALACVYYDRERNVFVATDSRVLAIVEPPKRDDIEGLPDGPCRDVRLPTRIVRAALRETTRARSSKPLQKPVARREVAVVTANGAAEAHIETMVGEAKTVRSGTEELGRFPNWPDVLPCRTALPHSFVMDPKYLMKIAKFYADNGSDCERGITVRFNDSQSSLEFSGELSDGRTAYVIAMPMSSDVSDAKSQQRPAAHDRWARSQPPKVKKTRKRK